MPWRGGWRCGRGEKRPEALIVAPFGALFGG
jgi:hypothetical protein